MSLRSVYSGHQSILIPPSELEVNPSLWLSAVSQYKVRDTFCSYSVMELCTKGLGLQTEALKVNEGERKPMKLRLISPSVTSSVMVHPSRLPSVSRVGLVPCEDLCGRGGGASQDGADAVLLQTFQGPGAPPTSCQHFLWLQGQPGNLPAGQSRCTLFPKSAWASLCGRGEEETCK